MVRSKSQSLNKQQKNTDSKTPSTRKPTRLGRGLSALMAHSVQVGPRRDDPIAQNIQSQPMSSVRPASANEAHHQQDTNDLIADPSQESQAEGMIYLPINAITANPHQPRQNFNDEAIQRLADSIRSNGLMQPIIVRPTHQEDQPPGGEGMAKGHTESFQLVAGERRWRAAQLAGLKSLPAIVRTLDDRQLAEWALIENLQREDLNPIERAKAFQNLIDQFQLSHDLIAQRVGVERPTVSNSLRLLKLCDYARQLVQDGLLSAGQAKALAGVSDLQHQQILAQRAVAEGWSVRQVEQELRRIATTDKGSVITNRVAPSKSIAHLRDLEQQLSQTLQTKVKIKSGRKKGSGTLSIEYYSLDQFDDLMQRMNVRFEMD